MNIICYAAFRISKLMMVDGLNGKAKVQQIITVELDLEGEA